MSARHYQQQQRISFYWLGLFDQFRRWFAANLLMGLIFTLTLVLGSGPGLAQEGINIDDRVDVAFTGLRLNNATRTFDTVMTMRNVSDQSIREPLTVVFLAPEPAVTFTLLNAYGNTVAGDPYVLLPVPSGELPPGEEVQAVLRFQNPNPVGFAFDYIPMGVVPQSNTPPVADAGDDRSVFINSSVELDGSRSSDRDGDPLTYAWTLIDKPAGSTAELIDPTTVRPSLEIDWPGIYLAELSVSDGLFNSLPDRVRLVTEDVPPTADPGPDQTTFIGDTVVLDGSGSTSAVGLPLTYDWTLLQRPTDSVAVLNNADSIAASFTVDQPGVYQVRLIVNDGFLDSLPAVATISTSNSRPVANAGDDQSVSVADLVQLDGTGSNDADGDDLSFAWSIMSAPQDSNVTLTDPVSAQPSFEPDIAGLYVLQLIVSDGILLSDPDSTQVEASEIPPVNGDPQITSTPVVTATTGQPYSYLVQAIDPDGDPLVYSLAMAPSGMALDSQSGEIAWLPEQAGTVPVSVQVTDGRGGQAQQSFSIAVESSNEEPEEPLPPDPGSIAPPVDTTVASTILSEATEFLYTGSTPIQTGVAPDTIEAKRAAVLRGRVLNRSNQPLAGVKLTVKDHPEFGQTLSRADGMFDMAVNGGGLLTLRYEKDGYLTAHRQIRAPWQDFALPPDVVLVQLDSEVTSIMPGSDTLQIARGGTVNDSDGARQATLLFQPGSTATMTLPDGSVVPLTAMDVRATEYTVGDNGPEAMPAALPANSGYTYAVEFSVDQAIAANATRVDFNQPVIFHLENFLNFPVGEAVPAGYFDRQLGQWIASDNGLVIKLISINGGLAQLDLDGNGEPNTAEEVAELGITTVEQEQLASIYEPGQTLWRVLVPHFTPWDYNWPFGPPEGAVSPNQASPSQDNSPDNSCEKPGSIIECESQILGERIPIVGTPFSLNYRSDRVKGNAAARTLDIPLTNTIVPANLSKIELEILVAGRRITETFQPQQNLRHVFVWDGNDAYGRRVQGSQPVTVRIGYVYPLVYLEPAEFQQSFGSFSGAETQRDMSAGRDNANIIYWQTRTFKTGSQDLRNAAVGGWSLDPHHIYDPVGQVLYLGDGKRQSAEEAIGRIEAFAGSPVQGSGTVNGGDGGPATSKDVNIKPEGLAVTPDGHVLISDRAVIRQVSPDGIITTIAGISGQHGYSGDGGLAIEAQLNQPHGLATAPDGSIFIADRANHVIRKIDPDGYISTVAGGGLTEVGDEIPAIDAYVRNPDSVAVTDDGSLLIAENDASRIRRVSPDGIISTIAGGFGAGFSGDGGLASKAKLSSPKGITVTENGRIRFADAGNSRIREIGTDGIIQTIAGSVLGCQFTSKEFVNDGFSATDAVLNCPNAVVETSQGTLLIADTNNFRVRKIDQFGVIDTIVGTGVSGFSGNGGPAGLATIKWVTDMAIMPDGRILLADRGNDQVREFGNGMPAFNAGDLVLASSNGERLYRFDPFGRLISTISSRTQTEIYRFKYDLAGRLVQIVDFDNNITTVERDDDGNPTAIVAPFGQRTELAVNADGYLASISNPAGETHAIAYTEDGLLTSFTHPRGNASSYSYNDSGKLLQQINPEGGGQTLSRTELGDGNYTVSRTTAQNRETVYKVENFAAGASRRTVTHPDGSKAVADTETTGTVTLKLADGSVVESVPGPDPRFSMQAAFAESTVTTNGSLVSTVQHSRSVELLDEFDPLSLLSLTETRGVNGRMTSSRYTAADRTEVITTPAGRLLTAASDAQGRLTEINFPDLASVFTDYDSRGRISAIRQGAGANERLSTYAYNADGYLGQYADALGHEVYEYDPAGRIIKRVLPGEREILFEYDANGNIQALTPPGRLAHTFTYTDLDQKASYQPPGGDAINYFYNLDGQLSEIIYSASESVIFSRDGAGRLVTLSTPSGDVRYTYSAQTGEIARITAPGSVTLDFGYSGSLLTNVAFGGPVNGEVSFKYDSSFRMIEQQVNSGEPVVFGYDEDNLLINAGSLDLRYDSGNGLLLGTVLGIVEDHYEYNVFGEVIRHNADANEGSLYQVEYVRDVLGRVTGKTEIVDGVTSTYSYLYDSAGRLQSVNIDGVTASTYAYDKNGNRTLRVTPNGSETATHDEQDRLLSYGGDNYTYTESGQLLSKTSSSGETSYQYDVLGNLRKVSLPDGKQISYLIDGEGRRIGKAVNGTLVEGFLYQDQLNPIAQTDASGAIVSRFVYAEKKNTPAYMLKNGEVYRIVSNSLGSPQMVVNVVTGEMVQRLQYDVFGRIILDTNPGFQPFGFTGGLHDRDTGLVRLGARDYSPFSGRWTTKDPLLLFGDSPNPYQYAQNNPVNMVDPEGTWPQIIIPIVIYGPPTVSFILGFCGGLGLDCPTDGLPDTFGTLGQFCGMAVRAGWDALPDTRDDDNGIPSLNEMMRQGEWCARHPRQCGF
ncbi:PKD domain-containing protein [Marinobacter changyiensis]|uniref:NHL domain-containing protein n=1 Tax=Marinobacter changyiensis TaxID=2604091 RepID=UPI001264BD4E|nr:PKD domain-containing protein [Marinobacter changyiensis]